MPSSSMLVLWNKPLLKFSVVSSASQGMGSHVLNQKIIKNYFDRFLELFFELIQQLTCGGINFFLQFLGNSLFLFKSHLKSTVS